MGKYTRKVCVGCNHKKGCIIIRCLHIGGIAYPSDCPCNECFIKSMCSEYCDNRKNYVLKIILSQKKEIKDYFYTAPGRGRG
jgi:hypothetical protein